MTILLREKHRPSKSTSTAGSAAAKPEIVSFKAQPDTIKPGESVMISWEVKNTASVEISPTVGKVDANSNVLVQPTATTKYVLTAANAAGSVQQELSVTVLAVAVQKPDLILTDLFIMTQTVYMEVKNTGNEDSKGCRAVLYLNNIPETNTYVEAVRAGETRKVAFDNYAWKYRIGQDEALFAFQSSLQYELRACIDTENVIAEANENNNCRTLIYGQQFVYNFYSNSHYALWVTNYGTLTWPIVEGSQYGSAFRIESATMEDNVSRGPVLGTYPQPVANGWIQGRFGDFYMDEMRTARVRHFVMPPRVRFTATVGFMKGAPANSKAKFKFIAVDDAATEYILAEKVCANDGKVDTFDVDLSGTVGKQRSFVLRVEAQDAGGQGAVWIDPKLVQQMKDP